MRKELEEKVKKSISRLQAFCPAEGYYLAFSGGKDSIVCKQLLIEAGCKFDAHYRGTSVDPPELVRYIKQHHPDVELEVPRDKNGKPITMWNLIPKKSIPPTRLARYCCAELKEGGGDGRMVVTGVRWAESVNRKKNQGEITIFRNSGKGKDELSESKDFEQTPKGGVVLVNDNEESRRLVEQCYKRRKTSVNPIIDWEDSDIWEFIRDRQLEYCSLYDKGFERLGCIGCPMGRTRQREIQFRIWPKYKDAYMRAFERMITERKKKGLPIGNFQTAQSTYNWWLEYEILPDQLSLDDMNFDGEEE